MTKTIDTARLRERLQDLKGFTKKAWTAASFCRVRKEDGSWHESSKISVQRGVYGSMTPEDARLAAAAPELHRTATRLADELDEARAEIARLKGRIENAGTASTESEDMPEADLDTRLTAAGLLPLSQMLAPMNRFQVHAGMDDLKFFETWLERKVREYTAMQARYDLGDRDKKDDLYEWVIAHAGAYHDVLVNFRAARAGQVDKAA